MVRSLGMADDIQYTGGDEAYAVADSGRFRQIVRNLLTNARRYGGDEIVIHAAYEGGETVVSIRDNGAGVPRARWSRSSNRMNGCDSLDRAPPRWVLASRFRASLPGSWVGISNTNIGTA